MHRSVSEGRFDAVIALGCLEYLPDLPAVIDEFCRVLTEDGIFLGAVERCGSDCPDGDSRVVQFLDDWERFRMPEDEIKSMILERFEEARFDRIPGFILADTTGEHTQYLRVIARGVKKHRG